MTNFLDNILGNLFKSTTEAAGNEITKALFGRQDRISNRDYQFMQDLADSGNPREAARQNEFADLTTPNQIKNQGAFLEGVAPSQANAYNTIQNATHAADTERNVDRIKTTASELGMSPWELTGSSGANPLPSPSGNPPQQQNGRNDPAAFLSTLTPVAVAKMNNKTAIQQAKIAQETALATTQMQTNQADTASKRSTAEGRLPIQQAATAAAQAEAAIAQTGLANSQTDLNTQELVLKVVRLAYEILPREKMDGQIDIPGFSGRVETDVKLGFQQLISILRKSPTARTALNNKDDDALQKALATLPRDDWGSLRSAIKRIAKGAGDAGNAVMSFLDQR